MRRVVVWIACLLVLAPSVSGARDEDRRHTNTQMCRRMTKQIDHFENTVLVMAEQRGNDAWAHATELHIDRLKNQRADRCPEYGKERTAIAIAKAQAEQMKQLMMMAAKGAAKYFSGGWF